MGQPTRYRELPARRRTRGALAGVALAAALAAAPSVAHSEDRGVHLDPGSPVGKEYVIPLEEARGVGRRATTERGGPPAFGAGIRRIAPAAASPARAGATGGGHRSAGAGELGTAGAASRSATVEAGGPPTLLFAGGAAAVVLLLGGAGLALVRRLARRP